MRYTFFWFITSRVLKLPFTIKVWYFILLYRYNKRKNPDGIFTLSDYVLWCISL